MFSKIVAVLEEGTKVPNNLSVEPSWHADGDKARCVRAGGVAQT